MLLSSPAYFVFLAAVFFAFWLADRNRTAGLAVILFANCFFYAKWGWIYLAIVPVAASCDFLIGRAIDRSEHPLFRRALLTASILLNTGLIVSLKYLPWVAHIGWILPVGLSFYAFQSLTYTIDIYRRDAPATTNYLAYLCSAGFFPTMLAGPITRLPSLVAQMQKDRLVDTRAGGEALFLIGLGLTKKLLIADYLGETLVNRVFDLPKLYSGAEVLAAVYGYAFQLYADFSGYTDIAIGSALLLGLKLSANFRRPYAAENIADFWRRWHITLSNWLRDYLYFSLPGLRSRWKIFAYGNLILTMAIGGLWHGASWTFLVWGVIHGAGLALVRLGQALRAAAGPGLFKLPRVPRILRIVATFHFVAFGWIFFRAPSLSTARDILVQIASMTVSFHNIPGGFGVVLAVAAIFHYLPDDWYRQSQDAFIQCPFYVQAAAMTLLVAAIRYVARTGSAPFIYTRF